MSFRAERITREIKRKDPKLFCAYGADGKLCIWRESVRYEHYAMDGGIFLVFARSVPHFVTALTTNWTIASEPADWGIEPILKRIDSLDLWKRDIASEIEKQEEEHQASCERNLKNNNEAFARELRPAFKKAFSDVRVANLSKTDNRKKREKSVHN